MAESKARPAKKPATGYKRFEKNIYREYRSAESVRFKVEVYPLPASTKTYDRKDEEVGRDWARSKRLELIEPPRDSWRLFGLSQAATATA